MLQPRRSAVKREIQKLPSTEARAEGAGDRRKFQVMDSMKREIQNAENRPYDAGDSQARRKFQWRGMRYG